MFGIVERVLELEIVEKIYYLLYYVVIWKDVKIIKFRVVYDVFLKEGKRGVLLNDCLYVGFILLFLLYEIFI